MDLEWTHFVKMAELVRPRGPVLWRCTPAFSTNDPVLYSLRGVLCSQEVFFPPNWPISHKAVLILLRFCPSLQMPNFSRKFNCSAKWRT